MDGTLFGEILERIIGKILIMIGSSLLEPWNLSETSAALKPLESWSLCSSGTSGTSETSGILKPLEPSNIRNFWNPRNSEIHRCIQPKYALQ